MEKEYLLVHPLYLTFLKAASYEAIEEHYI